MWNNPIVQSLVVILSTFVLAFLFRKFLAFLQRRFLAKNEFWQLSLVSTVCLPIRVFLWFTAILIIADILCSAYSGIKCFDINHLAEMGILTVLGWFLFRWKNQWVAEMKTLSEDHKVAWTPTQLDLVNKLSTIIISVVIGISLLEASGRDVQTILAFGGIGGLVIAFASQQVIANFFGGMMIYVTRPFSIGENIILPERKIEGMIEEIGWYMTRLRNVEKRPVYIPNSIFTQTFVVTHSRMSHQLIKEVISIRQEDLVVLTKILDDIISVLEKHPKIDQNQKKKAFLIALAPSSLDIEISAYVAVRHNAEFDSIRQSILLEVGQIIQKHGAQVASMPSVIVR